MATIVLLLLCLSIAIRSTTASDANASTSHLNEACKQTFDNDLCVKALSIYPKSQTFDFHGLAGLAIRAAASAASKTSTYISGLLDDESTVEDENFQQCLYGCEEGFVDAFDQLDESTVAMDKKAYEDVNLWVTVAKADGEMCDEGCKNVSPDKKVKLVAKSEEFSRLCSIVLNMTSFLATNHIN